LRTTDADTQRLLGVPGGPEVGTPATGAGAGAPPASTPTSSTRAPTGTTGDRRDPGGATGRGPGATTGSATPGAAATAPAGAASGPVVYSSNQNGTWAIYRLDPGASAPVRLTSSSFDDTQPAWSPDHRRIAFVRTGGDGMGDIYTMAPDGSALMRLTTDPGDDRLPAWSPDGRRLAFISDRLGESSGGIRFGVDQTPRRATELWVMDADGAEQRRILAARDTQSIADPDWSPDGTAIVYAVANDQTVATDIGVLDVATGDITIVLSDGAFDREPVWSPDGESIAFRIDQGSSSQLAVMSRTGTNVRRITSGQAFSFLPTWSRDGSTLLYSRDVDGPRYRYSSGVECAAVREDPSKPADVCPTGPAPSELWTVRLDGTSNAAYHAEAGADAADGSW
jgi:Tol biopolymer transport system component